MRRGPILILEDDNTYSEMMERALLQISVANDIIRFTIAEDLLDWLWFSGKYHNRKNTSPPSVLILDIHLPGMSGITVLNLIRNGSQYRLTPVVVLSADFTETTVNRAYNAGANSYLEKPHDLTELYSALSALNVYWTFSNVTAGKYG